MISKEHKAIFIHIEKTAGSSIEQKLGLYDKLQRGAQDHTKLRYYEHIAQTSYTLSNIKHSLSALKRGKNNKAAFYIKNLIAPVLTKKEYDSFYKFTFVRNTWSRLDSYYNNIMKDQILRKLYGITEQCSLYNFVKEVVDVESFNQLAYITDSKGEIPLDFIGQFEFLQRDFAKVANDIKLVNPELPHLLKRSKETNYQNNYDENTKDLVFNLYRKEIEYFKFEF